MTEDCKEKTISHPKLILNFQIFFLNIFMFNFQFPDFIKEKTYSDNATWEELVNSRGVFPFWEIVAYHVRYPSFIETSLQQWMVNYDFVNASTSPIIGNFSQFFK